VFWFSLKHLSKTFLILRRIKRERLTYTYTGLHVKYPLFLSDISIYWNVMIDFRKIPNTKFRENQSNGCRVVPCARTARTKPTVAFRNFAKAPKTQYINCPILPAGQWRQFRGFHGEQCTLGYGSGCIHFLYQFIPSPTLINYVTNLDQKWIRKTNTLAQH